MGKTYFAVHHFEIIPCHPVKNGKRTVFHANSRRDKRVFTAVFADKALAEAAVIDYENKISKLL